MAMTRGRYVPTEERLKKYDISREHFDAVAEEQGGMCAICAERPIEAIDHCHEGDVFRGLLCSRCNAGLGFFRHNPQTLMNAAEYLLEHHVNSDGEGDENDYDTSVPRQPLNWYRGSPWPLFGYTVEFGQDEETGAWMTISRKGEVVGEVNILVPPRPQAKAEIWVRRRYRNELPARDTGTFD